MTRTVRAAPPAARSLPGERLLSAAASAGGGVLQFVLSLLIAGGVLANAEGGSRLANRLCVRLAPGMGAGFASLAEQTVRSVATGVIGVALIQASLVAVGVFAIGAPAAPLVVLVCLLLGVVQLPVLIAVLPVIGVDREARVPASGTFTGSGARTTRTPRRRTRRRGCSRRERARKPNCASWGT